MSKSPRRGATTWPSDILCSEFVQVFARAETLENASAPAVIEAISETEAVLYSEAPMRRGAAVQVSADSWSFQARIAGCRKDAETSGFLILARFEEPFRWTAGTFSPKHTFDIRTLAGLEISAQTQQQFTERVISAGQSI